MCRDDSINYAIRTPSTVRRVMKVWPKLIDDLFKVFNFTHTRMSATDSRIDLIPMGVDL